MIFARARFRLFFPLFLLAVLASPAHAQQRREREPNAVYAERRAKLAAQVDGPVVLIGYTEREQNTLSNPFVQEENFYYLTGLNEEGAALVILPEAKKNGANGDAGDAPREILYLPPRDARAERWNGSRLNPETPEIAEKSGFAAVKPFAELRATVETLAKKYTNFYTLLPRPRETGGFPHEETWKNWFEQVVPGAKLRDVSAPIGAMRQAKSPGELAFLTKAIELSLDAHIEAMRMMRPGLIEYQVAARMVEVHAMGGSEAEGYAPIVGTGFNSTVLHYDRLDAKVEDGDVVVLDVAAQYSGYSADVTRTLPANGKFTPRQREIYEIVLGAQNAVLAALKPGMTFDRKSSKSLYKIAFDYINSHGRDKQGQPLGKYFIHGLGHHIGLNVHDAGDPIRPLEPGMIVTIEPGIYIPEEKLGVRIEDDVLITEKGYKLLSERAPRSVEEIEKLMAEAKKRREARHD